MNFPRERRPRVGRSRSRGGVASRDDASSGGETSDEEFPGKVPRKARRRRPLLRAYFALFVALEVLILALVEDFSPRFDFEITTVTASPDVSTVVGANPNLLYPIKLAGELCRPTQLAACVGNDTSAATLATACCTELLNPSCEGPEETISSLELLGYVLVVPALILFSRGFLLGRVWALRPWKYPPFGKPAKSESQSAWGKRRWHLRVGFFALDSVLGLGASVATATLFANVAKVTTGRPRPNYFALRLFSEYAANGKDLRNQSSESWPSEHASLAMAGCLFLGLVLWQDLMALVQWRRRSHPKITLVLAVLGGFLVAGLPMSAILIGISGIRDYMHHPDDVLAGLALGAASAYWSFRFLVVMPFRHEIGSPQWRTTPKWVKEEEREWAQEEVEVMRLCPLKSRKHRGRIRYESADEERVVEPTVPVLALAAASTEVPIPRRALEADVDAAIEKYDMSPV